MDEKLACLPTWQHFSAKGNSLKVKFLGQPQTLGQETWPMENSNLSFYF